MNRVHAFFCVRLEVKKTGLRTAPLSNSHMREKIFTILIKTIIDVNVT